MKRIFATLFALSLCVAVVPAIQAQTPNSALSISQWVRVEDGVVRGTVVAPKPDGALEAVSDVEVLISRRDGKSFRVAADSQGRFQIEDIEPGVYAMSVWQGKMLAACALHVIDSSHDPDSKYPNQALVSIADVDRPTVKTAIIRYLPAGVRTAPQFLSAIDFAGLAPKVRTSGNMLRIAQTNGGLTGRLFVAGATGSELQAASMSNVFVLRDGDQVDRALTNEQGEFVFEQLSPGIYSMLAIGPGGMGLIGFELTSDLTLNRDASNRAEGNVKLANTMQAVPHELSMQLAPIPEAIDGMDSQLDDEIEVIEQDGVPLVFDENCEECFAEPVVDACCSPICGGGVHGGGGGAMGGGGGGGGFGGGLGGIGALVGIAAVAATSSDDNLVILPEPASPALP